MRLCSSLSLPCQCLDADETVRSHQCCFLAVTRIGEVVLRYGVTVGGFYKHFHSRGELVIEALAIAFQDLGRWEEHPDTLTKLSGELFVRRTP